MVSGSRNRPCVYWTLKSTFPCPILSLQRSPAVVKSGVVCYPIWLAYATGVLEQSGFEVKLLDAPAAGHDLQDVLQMADEFQPRLVVIDTSTPSIYNDVEVAEAIKGRNADTFILLVGPTSRPWRRRAWASAPPSMPSPVGNTTIRCAMSPACWPSGGDLATVAGLSYRHSSGVLVHNPDRPPSRTWMPCPLFSEVYKRHLRIEDYFYSIARYPEVTIVTGRGCPYRCTYCLSPQTITGHEYRRRSVVNVADDVRVHRPVLSPGQRDLIEDDTLTVDQERCIALAQELIQRGNRLPFTANSRANVSFETLSWLKRAGLRLLCVGFESGDQGVLNAMRKGIKVEQFYRFREDARRAGVLVHGCFMAGGPGETHETLARTLDLAKALDPDTAQSFP